MSVIEELKEWTHDPEPFYKVIERFVPHGYRFQAIVEIQQVFLSKIEELEARGSEG